MPAFLEASFKEAAIASLGVKTPATCTQQQHYVMYQHVTFHGAFQAHHLHLRLEGILGFIARLQEARRDERWETAYAALGAPCTWKVCSQRRLHHNNLN